MKKLIKSLSVLSLLLSVFFIQSCRKPKPVDDPCKNPVQVTAVDVSETAFAHFTSQSEYLFAVNFSAYADQIVAGNDYQMSYVEVQCNEVINKCGSSIREGGCFPRKKCIKITCLKPIRNNCLGTELNVNGYNEASNCMSNVYGIFGTSLKARAGFSGCSEEESRNLRLYLKLLPFAGPGNNEIWEAKIVNPRMGAYTCQAYFEKDLCFDLSAINNYYSLLNIAPNSKVVTIRFIKGEDTFDFDYKF